MSCFLLFNPSDIRQSGAVSSDTNECDYFSGSFEDLSPKAEGIIDELKTVNLREAYFRMQAKMFEGLADDEKHTRTQKEAELQILKSDIARGNPLSRDERYRLWKLYNRSHHSLEDFSYLYFQQFPKSESAGEVNPIFYQSVRRFARDLSECLTVDHDGTKRLCGYAERTKVEDGKVISMGFPSMAFRVACRRRNKNVNVPIFTAPERYTDEQIERAYRESPEAIRQNRSCLEALKELKKKYEGVRRFGIEFMPDELAIVRSVVRGQPKGKAIDLDIEIVDRVMQETGKRVSPDTAKRWRIAVEKMNKQIKQESSAYC